MWKNENMFYVFLPGPRQTFMQLAEHFIEVCAYVVICNTYIYCKISTTYTIKMIYCAVDGYIKVKTGIL